MRFRRHAGFYVCKLKKLSNGKKAGTGKTAEEGEGEGDEVEPQVVANGDTEQARPLVDGALAGKSKAKGKAKAKGKRKAEKGASAEGEPSFMDDRSRLCVIACGMAWPLPQIRFWSLHGGR